MLISERYTLRVTVVHKKSPDKLSINVGNKEEIRIEMILAIRCPLQRREILVVKKTPPVAV